MKIQGLSRTLDRPFDEVLGRVPAALAAEGFGILTEIDVTETLKKKLGVDFRRYRILGACNPSLAHEALQQRLDIGLLLPCNVVVYEDDDGQTVVSAMDPSMLADSGSGDAMEGIAWIAREKLERALTKLSE